MDIHLQKGDRIRLIAMRNDPAPVTAGSLGTVLGLHEHLDWTQVEVEWDSGRKLMLTIPPDHIEKLSEQNLDSSRKSRLQVALKRINEKYSEALRRLAE